MNTDPIAAARALIAAQPDLLFRCDLCSEECNCHPHHDMSMSGGDILCDGCEDFDAVATPPDPLKLIAKLADAVEIERVRAGNAEIERDILVAAAYKAAAELVARDHVCDAIRALTPANTQAALDKMLTEARLEGWRAGRDAAAWCLEQGADEYSCGCDPIHCRCHHNIEQMRIDADAIRALPEPKGSSHG